MKEVRYTFKSGSRYITKGINTDMPLEIQVILWGIIDSLVRGSTTADYLQVFRFVRDNNEIVITHTQESPEYKKEYRYPMKEEYDNLINRTVFSIDDINHSTMLWSNEY